VSSLGGSIEEEEMRKLDSFRCGKWKVHSIIKEKTCKFS
jgi:hypothetical protein